tara:strand:- start:24 stop:1151 length:1128 start_codon:yes stop_codon:yes gene_type:complete
MRGIVTGGDDALIHPNSSDAESIGNTNEMDLTSTGFKLAINDSGVNGNGNTYVYTAIRRPDGYVGKPAEAGTDVFAMDTGNSSSTIPAMDSGFPVDWALVTQPASIADNWSYARLMSGRYMKTNSSDAGDVSSAGLFDSNVGFYQGSSYNSNYQSWMFKRHAGFDVLTYTGNGTAGRVMPHSLSKTPEMMWIKRRNSSRSWFVYHKSLDGGNNPETHYLLLDSQNGEGDEDTTLNDTAPTSTHFTLGTSATTNGNNDTYLALLFASISGISAVGSYTGNGTGGTNAISLGFAPRFIIIKNYTNTDSAWSRSWFTFDTTRGWASGNNDKRLALNTYDAQSTEDWIDPTSTGFSLNTGNAYNHLNTSGNSYIYYAHA